MKHAFIILLIIFGFIFISGCAKNQNISTLSCDKLETKVKNLIVKANHCTKDDDCDLLGVDYYGGCPFGCANLVNKNENFEPIKSYVIEYRQRKCPKSECMYKCGKVPALEDIKCKNNKCIDIRYEN